MTHTISTTNMTMITITITTTTMMTNMTTAMIQTPTKLI
jgi:hypothetical protein